MEQETNEFAPDSIEAHEAAAIGAVPEVVAPVDPLAAPVPAQPLPPTEDLDGEGAAGEALAEVVPGPVPAEPVVVAPAAVSTENRHAEIHGLKDGADLSLEGKALETKIILSKQPKVRMMIPLDPGEKAGAYRTVIINGYRFDVRKNTMVDLPEAVAVLLAKSYQITSEVLEDNPLNLNGANSGAKSSLGM